jgi:hypothetical protein
MKTTTALLLIAAATLLQSCSTAKLSTAAVSTNVGYFNIKASPRFGHVLLWKKTTKTNKIGSVNIEGSVALPKSYEIVDAEPSGKLQLEVNKVGDVSFGGPIASDLGAQAELKASLKRYLTFELSDYRSRTLNLSKITPGALLGSKEYRRYRESLIDTAVIDSDDYRVLVVIRDIYAKRAESKVGSGPASDGDKTFSVAVGKYNVKTTASRLSSALGVNSYAIVDFAVYKVVSDSSIKERIPGALGINFERDYEFDSEQLLKDYK